MAHGFSPFLFLFSLLRYPSKVASVSVLLLHSCFCVCASACFCCSVHPVSTLLLAFTAVFILCPLFCLLLLPCSSCARSSACFYCGIHAFVFALSHAFVFAFCRVFMFLCVSGIRYNRYSALCALLPKETSMCGCPNNCQ